MWTLFQKHIFLHFPLITLPSHEALTWVVHQFKRVDFFSLSISFFSFLPQQIGSVRNERYSCRHAILVMKSQLDLLHDWFCNLLFSGSSKNEMMSCWTSFKYPWCIGRNGGKESVVVPGKGEGTWWPHKLKRGQEKRTGERFVFKWGLEVGGSIGWVCYTTEREKCVWL